MKKDLEEARKNTQEVFRDWLMNDEPKGVFRAEEKDYGKLQMQRLSWETMNLILEKDKDKMCFKKNLLTTHKLMQYSSTTTSKHPSNYNLEKFKN